jgi:serine/threonine-protein kinase
MANVYVGRGVTDEGHEEIVALKVMRDEYGHDPKYLRMFSDEAKILARLSHPNVIRTLESGIAKEHRYIVMELLAGRTLADVWDLVATRKERLPFHLAAWICGRIAEGLHAAHELTDAAGAPMAVVHRDVNPSNIFLTHEGEVKLIDFGLAKSRVRRTQSAGGVVKGKVPYLAPEQIASRPIDRRIDLFALGTTLWEALTMTRLFKRPTDIETALAIRDGTAPDPREIVESVPAELCAITGRALRRDPDERYATASEMQADLDELVAKGGGDRPPREELAALVMRLFPGEEARYSTWRRDAIAQRVLATAPPPPMPVPSASTNLLGMKPTALPVIALDDCDIEIITRE